MGFERYRRVEVVDTDSHPTHGEFYSIPLQWSVRKSFQSPFLKQTQFNGKKLA